ncbi:YIP1 family protein [Chitinilyticum piscinae]|uniref:YIP1 family protein n=1 Tax=Chitinilyticum piscinae TaxID=2866724 RepID=A0A8J7K2T2_9NEIS|nr:YIP1 family protein [Chitinilyticum piscinae]MBE9610931.1 YIP1 family protein [Chitinilyticum piscinae]
MHLYDPLRMLYSSDAGWRELADDHPSILRSFLLLVLPASLFGAIMVLYAATTAPQAYAPEAGMGSWYWAAAVLLLSAWFCVPLMAKIIQHSVHAAVRPPLADCYKLAAIVPLPIWLSALSLFIAIPAVNVICALLGLLASACLLYHGLDALFEHDDSVETIELAYNIFSFGALVWCFIVALVLVPLLLLPAM